MTPSCLLLILIVTVLATLSLDTLSAMAVDAGSQHAIQFFVYHKRLASKDPSTSRLFSRSSIVDFLSPASHATRDECSSLVPLYLQTTHEATVRSADQVKSLCNLATSCQTATTLDHALALLHNSNSTTISSSLKDAVGDLCPLLLAHSLDPGCHLDSRPSDEGRDSASQPKNSPLVVWGMAFLCVTLISLTSLVGVVIVPFLNKASYLNVLNLFEGLAVGTFSRSTASVHLLPSLAVTVTPATSSPSTPQAVWSAVRSST